MNATIGLRPRPLGSDSREVERAARVLSIAFADDPVSDHVDGDPRRRAQAVRAIFDALLARSGDRVVVDVVGDPIDGVAIWLPPDDPPSDEVDLWASLSLPFPGQLERFRQAIGALDEAHANVLAGPHWYLLFVGTDPSSRGHGIGGALVRAHDADADAADVPCGLETFGDGLRAFYEHLGWEVGSTTAVPFSAEPLHSMLRRPRQRPRPWTKTERMGRSPTP
jgi:GNAT superfamily N-acetyltransferase